MKTCRILTILFVGLLACQRQEQPVTPAPDPVTDPVPDLVKHTLYASTPGEDAPETRTQISVMDDKKVVWSAHESISILAGEGNYAFEGDNDGPAASATFTGMGPADLGSYIALYPYEASASYAGGYVSTSLPATQTGKAGSFADGYLITADDATGNSITFNHVCSGLRFMVNSDKIKAVSIRGNNGEKIAGDFRFRFASEDTPVAEAGTEECVTLTAPGGHFEIGTSYYIVTLPTVFTKGFTLYADDGTQIGELRFDSSITFSPGIFKNITGNLNARMAWTTPKVYYGQENSFCLRPGNTVSFDVSPRLIHGSWQRSGVPVSADTPASAEVLWGGGSISSASIADGQLTITASSTPGSALVAIKNASGTILWSYLIWVTESAPAETELPTGAKILPPLGGQLYFQWGRKDPLLSSATRVSNQGSGGLAYSISHPTEFIQSESNAYDWITDDTNQIDWTLWGEDIAKTVWDPCPAGYRVPSKEDYADITDEFMTSNFVGLGYISDDGFDSEFYSYFYCYWTRSTGQTGDVRDVSWYLNKDSSDKLSTTYRNMAYPVRCVKE